MINYQNLADSVEFYKERGYTSIEVPWTVTEYVDDITKPADRVHYQLMHNKKCLVASGEQGFLYLYLKDYLPKGKFQTITPCFRDEPYDLFHEKCFMKNELIITDEVNEENLKKIIADARDFFCGTIGCPPENVKVVEQHDTAGHLSYDLNFTQYICSSNGFDTREVELGSYGIRKTEFLTWIYGTGCAEPRLSKCKQLYKKDYGRKQ
jgi:seryl-tRNA synthetase